MHQVFGGFLIVYNSERYLKKKLHCGIIQCFEVGRIITVNLFVWSCFNFLIIRKHNYPFRLHLRIYFLSQTGPVGVSVTVMPRSASCLRISSQRAKFFAFFAEIRSATSESISAASGSPACVFTFAVVAPASSSLAALSISFRPVTLSMRRTSSSASFGSRLLSFTADWSWLMATGVERSFSRAAWKSARYFCAFALNPVTVAASPFAYVLPTLSAVFLSAVELPAFSASFAMRCTRAARDCLALSMASQLK